MPIIDTSTSLQNSTLVTTAETLVLASILPLPVGPTALTLAGGTGVQILVIANITAGTGATGITVRARRGFGTSGNNDGQYSSLGCTAGATGPITSLFSVNPAWLLQSGGGQYSITFQQVGATGNATILQASALYYTIGD
jgi:hypothetical protein